MKRWSLRSDGAEIEAARASFRYPDEERESSPYRLTEQIRVGEALPGLMLLLAVGCLLPRSEGAEDGNTNSGLQRLEEWQVSVSQPYPGLLP